jgi:hypothetical protein
MKPKTLTVKAAVFGRPVFMSGYGPRRVMAHGKDLNVITFEEARIVPNTRYYQRRIVKGDLVIVEESKPVAESKPLAAKPKLKEE